MDPNCIFCKIIAGEIPSEKIYEDQDVMAFMDIRPVSRGHALVVPKNHTSDFLVTKEEALAILIPKVKKIAKALMKAVNAQGMNITTNTGEAAGQSVFHLHFHLIPRFSGDNLPPWPHHETAAEMRVELAEKIRKLL